MTRDLARKVYAIIEPLTRDEAHDGLTAQLIIPGFKKATKTCISNVVIGTPDMIEKEIYKRQYLDISALKELVFDEAYDLIKLDVVIGKIAVFLSKAEHHIFKILHLLPLLLLLLSILLLF